MPRTELIVPPAQGTLEDLPPGPLAEALPFEAIQARLDIEQSLQPSPFWRERTRHQLRLGWLEAECGLSAAVGEKQAEAYFMAAGQRAQEVLKEPRHNFYTVLHASRLLLHLDGLQARRASPQTASGSGTILAELGGLLARTQAAPIHAPGPHKKGSPLPSDHQPCFGEESRKRLELARLTTQIVCEWAGLRVFAGSSRELPNHDTEFRRYEHPASHDFYGLSHGGDAKLPFRVRLLPGRRYEIYDPPVIRVVYSQLVQPIQALDPQLASAPIAQIIPQTFDIVNRKAQGDDISARDQAILNTMIGETQTLVRSPENSLTSAEFLRE